jgi:hypothetical protein
MTWNLYQSDIRILLNLMLLCVSKATIRRVSAMPLDVYELVILPNVIGISLWAVVVSLSSRTGAVLLETQFDFVVSDETLILLTTSAYEILLPQYLQLQLNMTIQIGRKSHQMTQETFLILCQFV